MNESEHLDRSVDLPAESFQEPSSPEQTRIHSYDPFGYERIVSRLLRNILIVSVLLIGPAFKFYGWPGTVGFAFGAAVSYFNFHALEQSVEGLSDRIVNRDSREKGGWIILRFMMRYGLVAAMAYAIFMGSVLAFRGFLWGLCVPVAALMIEAVLVAYMIFRRQL
jgi:hypothetical protein